MASYKLALSSKGISYKGSDEGTSNLELTVDNTISATYKGQTMSFSLYGVSFHRKMYEPSHIQAEILIKLDIKSVVNSKTQERTAPSPPTLDTLSAMLMHRPVILYVDGTNVAENFYIHEIAPQYYISTENAHIEYDNDGNEDTQNSYYYYTFSIYTKLDIFSMDKMFTLNKYSRAYLGKKLFEEIITGQLSDMPAVFSYKAGGKDVTENLVLTMPEASTRTLQHLSYKSGTETKEMICPYLVQYNESPYDFFTRVANRFGEPLFFEDGKLCYGLSATVSSTLISNAESVIFQRISQPPYKVSDNARDDAKEWGEKTFKDSKGNKYKKMSYEPDNGQFLSDDIEYKPGEYPSDAFAILGDDALKNGHYPYFYNMEYSADDQYQLLYKDKISRSDEDVIKWWGGEGWSAFFPVLSDVLNSTSLLDLLSNFLSSMTTRGIQAGIRGHQRRKFWNVIYEKYRNSSNDDYAVLFANVDNDRGHWCTFNYYWDIKQQADELKRRMVCVDMGPSNTSTVKIGDRITLPYDGGTYVVVQIDMCNSTACEKSYFGFDDPALLTPGTQQQRIYAIPLGDDKLFYPPLLSDRPYPKSGPQPAFVVDNNDPLFQGRVRVSFTWQPSYDVMDKVVKEYESTINNWSTDLKAAITYLKKFATVQTGTDGRVTSCTQKSDAKDADYTNAKNQYDAVVAKYDTANAVKDLAIAKRNLYKDIDSGTPWIRVATPMASPGGGMFFRPEIGDEVMVDFENGNMERPYVVGSLYSKNNTQPWQGERVIVSKNGHTIRFTDPNNASMLGTGLYPGMKYLASIGAVGKQLKKIEEEPLPCVGGIELTDTWGLYDIKMSSHDRNITISSPFGDVKMNALTGISVSAPNGNIKISGKNVEIHASNRLSVTSGENIKNGGYFGDVSASGAGRALGNLITGISGLDKWLDFSILRTLLEIIIRPVDGTLELKSYRYLLMEAGGGDAYIKPDFYRKDSNNINLVNAAKYTELQAFYEIFLHIQTLDSYAEEFRTKYNQVNTALGRLTDNIDIEAGGNGSAHNCNIELPVNKETLISNLFSLDDLDALNTYLNDSSQFKIRATVPPRTEISLRHIVKSVFLAIKAVQKQADKFTSYFDYLDTTAQNIYHFKKYGSILAKSKIAKKAAAYAGTANTTLQSDTFHDSARTINLTNDLKTDVTSVSGQTAKFNTQFAANKYDTVVQLIKRIIAFTILEDCKDNGTMGSTFKVVSYFDYLTNEPYFQHADWARYLRGLEIEESEEGKEAFKRELALSTLGRVFEDNPSNPEKNIWTYEKNIWDVSAVGEILFANNEAKTYHFIRGNTAIEGYDSPENGNDLVGYINRLTTLITY